MDFASMQDEGEIAHLSKERKLLIFNRFSGRITMDRLFFYFGSW